MHKLKLGLLSKNCNFAFSACFENFHLNNLLKSTSKSTANGWKVDCNDGVWKTPSYRDCKNWFGWKSNTPVGSISTKLNGSGQARLDFGNCHYEGQVKSFKNDVEIASLEGHTWAQIEIEFQDGDVIRLTEGLTR